MAAQAGKVWATLLRDAPRVHGEPAPHDQRRPDVPVAHGRRIQRTWLASSVPVRIGRDPFRFGLPDRW